MARSAQNVVAMKGEFCLKAMVTFNFMEANVMTSRFTALFFVKRLDPQGGEKKTFANTNEKLFETFHTLFSCGMARSAQNVVAMKGGFYFSLSLIFGSNF